MSILNRSNPVAAAPNPDVVIIGAGLAGAKIAYELSKSDYSYTIIEATDVIGGRMRQHKISRDGPFVEAGANWVHRYLSRGDVFSNFVKNTIKLKMHPTNFEDITVIDDGAPVKEDDSKPALDKLRKAMQKIALEADKAWGGRRVQLDMSVEAALLHFTGWQADTPLNLAALRFAIDIEYAIPASEMSLLDLSGSAVDENARIVEQDMFVTDGRGYVEVVRWHLRQAGLSDAAIQRGDGKRLRLNAPVTQVQYDGKGGVVTLKNGETIRGKAIVSTVSLGVLQYSLRETGAENYITFKPPLPEKKRLAISKMVLAEYTKLFVKLKRAIFSTRDTEFIIPLQDTSLGFISVQNLNKDKYFPGQNMVLLTATHTFSRALLRMSETQRIEEAVRFLSLATGSTVTSSDVMTIYMPEWYDNAYVRGAYSARTTGLTHEEYAAFNRRTGALFFAGEAHSEEYRGYVQGAWESGERAAKEVMKYLR